MKAKTFENLIRKVVREEIDYALRREIKTLKEDLRDKSKPTVTEHNEKLVEVPETTKNSLREKIMGNAPLKQRLTQNFTSNNALNDLLNETAQGDTNTETGNSSEMSVESMPAPVQNVVNRDYRELMQAINTKKGR
tara:strand:+ start:1222 stop:1629 length:408 start_codon:yes stop_codon:yes gene_type:complete